MLVISEKAKQVLRKEIGQYWVLKEESISPLSKYLGGKLCQVTLQNGVNAWAFGSSQYVQYVVINVHKHLAKKGMKIPYKAPNPLSTDYRHKIDMTPEIELSYLSWCVMMDC